MNHPADLLIVGGSARAAAFSALRAGLTPLCVDRFSDADLRQRCDWRPWSDLRRVAEEFPRIPWLYTGGMENRPALVRSLSRNRRLWGNDSEVLRLVRSPFVVYRVLRDAGLECPEVKHRRSDIRDDSPWLMKPLRSAGGAGIQFLSAADDVGPRHRYFQRYVDGESGSATYIADDRSAQLLGVTRQFVGTAWLHAAPFQYCGSLGPVPLTGAVRSALDKLGNVLTLGCGLQGLFGVDFIVRDDSPWTIEVNPRYTASMELVEFATGARALALHRRVFDSTVPLPPTQTKAGVCFGKAVLFATAPVIFPEVGPWSESIRQLQPVSEFPAFADVPIPGGRIAEKSPVLSFFAQAKTIAECETELRRIAGDLDRWLYRP